MNIDPRAAHAAYQQGQVGSAGPVHIVVLLYEGAIRFGRQALDSFDSPAIRGHAIGRSHRIVSELLASLDYDKGGDIARNLDSLYRFALDSLTQANTHHDRQALQASIQVLETLLAGWREIRNNPELMKQAAQSG